MISVRIYNPKTDTSEELTIEDLRTRLLSYYGNMPANTFTSSSKETALQYLMIADFAYLLTEYQKLPR